jgi:DAACS family dicarboxylate/amino acid:cation (Na+ or H+) symporter
MIPSNVLAAMAAQKIMPTLVFAILFGMGLASSGETAEAVVRGLEALLAATFRMTQWITATAPLAIAAIVAWLFADQGLKTVVALAKLIGVLYIGLAVLEVVFGIVLLLIGQRPIAIMRQMMDPV